MNCAVKIFLIYFLAFPITCQRQPTNITRADGETNVFIPCPFEFRPTPSIWRIGGMDYTATTIPPVYSITPGGLFINTVHVCMNQTSFQCIDTSDNALEEQLSDIGVLTVTSGDICPDDNLFVPLIPQLELDNQLTEYGNVNTTLAWKIVPVREQGDCNISHVLSFRRCEQNNLILNVTTDVEMITLSSASFQQSGELVDFSLSSSSDQQLEGCPSLIETLRFNVTETEVINLLVGNNNCTCVDVKRQGGLSFVISNPDPDELDIACRIHGTGCYNPITCNRFNDSGLIPFFHFCDNQLGNSHTLCFGNISTQLNGSRFELYSLKRALCSSTPVYAAREYFRSFELNVERASASISVNLTSREICFKSSSNDCSLTDLTQYEVSVVDISGSALFKRGNIPESSCLVVSQLELLPKCGPFLISTQPFNEYIMYNPDVQQITSESQPPDDEPKLCSCLEANIQLELAASYNSQTSTIKINYQCWTSYTSPVDFMVSVETGSLQTTCSNGTFNMTVDNIRCDHELHFCGNFAFINGSVLADCVLGCSNSILIPCPTTPTMGPIPDPNHSIGVIIGSVLGVVTALSVVVSVITLTLYCCVSQNNDKDKEEGTTKPNGEGTATPYNTNGNNNDTTKL